ncbi:hypothetical protein DASB73_014920 [Starmerella bacillaris]|uniref:Uncharacterized protein n=1 Tax=Starmerella bacillaris TaxID=1247836 RepID=A0AAV5RGB8_STABA|nr:hypothetical protein DASB73_014920 [Starmerella bacillaris]
MPRTTSNNPSWSQDKCIASNFQSKTARAGYTPGTTGVHHTTSNSPGWTQDQCDKANQQSNYDIQNK